MSIVLLDSGPLGRFARPEPAGNQPMIEWGGSLLAAGHRLRVPDIADYEVRRELSRGGRLRSVVQLNRLRREIGVAPVTAQAWLKAAELWAMARRVGQPTAGDRDLDGDVILAATALTYPTTEPVIVATDNVRHLARFCDARHWTEIG